MTETKNYQDKKTGKNVPHFAFTTEELTKHIERLEKKIDYLETGINNTWNELRNRSTKLVKHINIILDHENLLIQHLIRQQKEINNIKKCQKKNY